MVVSMLKIPSNCTGCYACVNICPKKCISMIESASGFLYPNIDRNQCIECGQCERVCPLISKVELSKSTVAFAVKNKYNEERNRSTSGGFFPLIAKYVISKGG